MVEDVDEPVVSFATPPSPTQQRDMELFKQRMHDLKTRDPVDESDSEE